MHVAPSESSAADAGADGDAGGNTGRRPRSSGSGNNDDRATHATGAPCHASLRPISIFDSAPVKRTRIRPTAELPPTLTADEVPCSGPTAVCAEVNRVHHVSSPVPAYRGNYITNLFAEGTWTSPRAGSTKNKMQQEREAAIPVLASHASCSRKGGDCCCCARFHSSQLCTAPRSPVLRTNAATGGSVTVDFVSHGHAAAMIRLGADDSARLPARPCASDVPPSSLPLAKSRIDDKERCLVENTAGVASHTHGFSRLGCRKGGRDASRRADAFRGCRAQSSIGLRDAAASSPATMRRGIEEVESVAEWQRRRDRQAEKTLKRFTDLLERRILERCLRRWHGRMLWKVTVADGRGVEHSHPHPLESLEGQRCRVHTVPVDAARVGSHLFAARMECTHRTGASDCRGCQRADGLAYRDTELYEGTTKRGTRGDARPSHVRHGRCTSGSPKRRTTSSPQLQTLAEGNGDDDDESGSSDTACSKTHTDPLFFTQRRGCHRTHLASDEADSNQELKVTRRCGDSHSVRRARRRRHLYSPHANRGRESATEYRDRDSALLSAHHARWRRKSKGRAEGRAASRSLKDMTNGPDSSSSESSTSLEMSSSTADQHCDHCFLRVGSESGGARLSGLENCHDGHSRRDHCSGRPVAVSGSSSDLRVLEAIRHLSPDTRLRITRLIRKAARSHASSSCHYNHPTQSHHRGRRYLLPATMSLLREWARELHAMRSPERPLHSGQPHSREGFTHVSNSPTRNSAQYPGQARGPSYEWVHHSVSSIPLDQARDISTDRWQGRADPSPLRGWTVPGVATIPQRDGLTGGAAIAVEATLPEEAVPIVEGCPVLKQSPQSHTRGYPASSEGGPERELRPASRAHEEDAGPSTRQSGAVLEESPATRDGHTSGVTPAEGVVPSPSVPPSTRSNPLPERKATADDGVECSTSRDHYAKRSHTATTADEGPPPDSSSTDYTSIPLTTMISSPVPDTKGTASARVWPSAAAPLEAPTAYGSGGAFRGHPGHYYYYDDDDRQYHRLSDPVNSASVASSSGGRVRPVYLVRGATPSPSRSRSPCSRPWEQPATRPRSPLGCGRLNPYCSICRARYHLVLVDETMQPVRWPSPGRPLGRGGYSRRCRQHAGLLFGDGESLPLANEGTSFVPVLFERLGVEESVPPSAGAEGGVPSTRAPSGGAVRGDVSAQRRGMMLTVAKGRAGHDTFFDGAPSGLGWRSSREALVPLRDDKMTHATEASHQRLARRRDEKPRGYLPERGIAPDGANACDAGSHGSSIVRRRERQLRRRMKQLLWSGLPTHRERGEWQAYVQSVQECLSLLAGAQRMRHVDPFGGN